ncbi:hypothetical protein [uncultured Erythrobacter sp.]|uniref:hypothetical protein n=1 Tax=uncultured Erythrobacter sp. TaxID=263913 RepID=UPI00261257CC|nr:hypothetical protein [uncultured Erythrobacter sp.]
MKPNEFGDFLAGVFAPLAFFWLVLGFFQQGRELRNSSEALWLQGEELRNSVEQQRDLVTVTREQLAFENELLSQQRDEMKRNAQPILRVVPAGTIGGAPGGLTYRFRVWNHGKLCTDVRLLRDGTEMTARPSLDTGENFEFNALMDPKVDTEFSIEIRYLDSRLLAGHAKYKVQKNGPDFLINDL